MNTKWALVPVESTLEMLDAGETAANARSMNTNVPDYVVDGAYSAMIQASPGAALLAEVLAARDAVNSDIGENEPVSEYFARKEQAAAALLAALDKLGPAPEGEA